MTGTALRKAVSQPGDNLTCARPLDEGTIHTLAALLGAAAACEVAAWPDRLLDARIALAVFPAMRLLPVIAVAIWRHPDGSRIRALNYTSSPFSAMTLLPSGHWLEKEPSPSLVFWARSLDSIDDVSGNHTVSALAIAAALLRARAHSAAREAQFGPPIHLKEEQAHGRYRNA